MVIFVMMVTIINIIGNKVQRKSRENTMSNALFIALFSMRLNGSGRKLR